MAERHCRTGDADGIPFYKRAIELDPNFALAYAALGASYFNLNQADLAAENATKAYELRDRVSERERYRISTTYYHAVTGELEKAIEEYQLWSKSYPREDTPHLNLGVIYQQLGQYDKSVAETKESLAAEANDDGIRQPFLRVHRAEPVGRRGEGVARGTGEGV